MRWWESAGCPEKQLICGDSSALSRVFTSMKEERQENTYSGLGWKSNLRVLRNSSYLHKYTHATYTNTNDFVILYIYRAYISSEFSHVSWSYLKYFKLKVLLCKKYFFISLKTKCVISVNVRNDVLYLFKVHVNLIMKCVYKKPGSSERRNRGWIYKHHKHSEAWW